MRYAFLQEAAEDYKADTLVTAHNADDQAETVIGRVLRGTSVDGVAGIPVRRQLSDSVTVVRPLLGMRRRDIESYCTLRQIIPRHDPSNDKERYTRTRLRKILPQLAESFNPRVWDALNRLSEHASVDSELLTRLTADVTASVVRRRTPQEIRLDREGLIDAHPALRRRVILAMIQQITGKAAEKAATWEWVLAVESILTETGTILTLPGAIRVTVQGGELVFLRVPPQPRPESTPIPVLVPGMTFAESYGLALNSVVTFDAREPFRERKSLKIEVAADESDAVSSALELRALKPGERIHPLGFSNHSRLVRDILAEAKVPVERRGVFPVVARADTGEILWVIGICQTEATRITSATRRRIRFEAVFDLAPSLGHSEKT
jgi:tRNA(Ile)-lysidine synthase